MDFGSDGTFSELVRKHLKNDEFDRKQSKRGALLSIFFTRCKKKITNPCEIAFGAVQKYANLAETYLENSEK